MPRLPWLRLAFGSILFGLLLVHTGPSEASHVLADASLVFVVLAVALNAPIIALVTLRSALLLARLGYSPPRDLLLSTATVGYVVGAMTPAAAGELLRVQALHQHAGVRVGSSLVLIAFERLLSFYLLCLSTAIIAAVTFLPWLQASPLVCLLLGAMCVPAFLGSTLKLLPAFVKSADHGRVRAILGSSARDVLSLFQDRIAVFSTSLISVSIFALVALQFWFLAKAAGSDIGIVVAWFGFGISQIAGIISMLPFGIGISDASLAGILAGFDVNRESALAIVLLVRVSISLPLFLAAAIAHLYLGLPRGTRKASDGLLLEEP